MPDEEGMPQGAKANDIVGMAPPNVSSLLRARRRTFRLHFYHAIGFPSYLADDLIRSGNLVGWCVTLRPLLHFAEEQLADHPNVADLRILFASASTVNTLQRRALTDLIDWITVRDEIWRQLRTHVHYSPTVHRESGVLEWEARRRRTLENLHYVVRRNVDPASTFASAVASEWDLTTSQILERGSEMGDQIVAWYRAQCEDLADGGCMQAILPAAILQFLAAVRSHHH